MGTWCRPQRILGRGHCGYVARRPSADATRVCRVLTAARARALAFEVLDVPRKHGYHVLFRRADLMLRTLRKNRLDNSRER
jgi:hypothetical protein